MVFDRQQELISGEAVGCHGDGAAHRGCQGSQRSLHRPGLRREGNRSAAPGQHTRRWLQPDPDNMGRGTN